MRTLYVRRKESTCVNTYDDFTALAYNTAHGADVSGCVMIFKIFY